MREKNDLNQWLRFFLLVLDTFQKYWRLKFLRKRMPLGLQLMRELYKKPVTNVITLFHNCQSFDCGVSKIGYRMKRQAINVMFVFRAYIQLFQKDVK